MRHALLVFALINLQLAPLLGERLPKAHHIAMTRQHEHAPHETTLLPVKPHVLVFQKAHQSLSHG